jgi:putative phosphoesterase
VAQGLTVGVISDTHGLLRPEALEALEGSDVILHAGDIGGGHVLDGLSELAPVVAVRGNVDGGWARLLPERRELTLGGVGALLLHDRALLGDLPFRARDALADGPGRGGRPPRPARELAGIVVFGHSHRPLARRTEGVLWFNPGSAGPRRFRLPVCVGRLEIREGRVRPRLVPLDV